MKVYALYSGCKFEGGGVNNLYSTKEKAVEAGELLFQEEQKKIERIYKDDEEHLKEFSWKEVIREDYWHEANIKQWSNIVDEIRIIEYDVL